MSSATFRRRLRLVALLAAGLVIPSTAQAQNNRASSSRSKPLADKKVDPESRVEPVRVATRPSPNRSTSVRPAAATTSSSTLKPTPSASQTRKPASQPSQVELASCKDCQSHGHSHSHNPIEIIHEEPVLDEHSTLYQPDAYQFQPDGCDSCGPGHVVHPLGLLGSMLRFSQFRVEAGTFWGDGQNLLPLVTTRRPPGDISTFGLLGRNDTVNLFGGEEVLGDSRQGVRGEIGLFFGPCRSRGLMIRMFDASSNTDGYNSANAGEEAYARPFFDSDERAQSALPIQFPGVTSGSIAASISSDAYGGDLLYRKTLRHDRGCRFEFLAGYQMMRLEESLSIVSESRTLTSGSLPLNTVSVINDHFETSNRFHGAAFGFNSHLREGCWSLGAMAKLGLGNVDREIQIRGSSQTGVPGQNMTTSSNGLLARSTNDGMYETNTFVVSPEVAVTLGYRFTRGLEATVSYSFLTLPKTARVGDQLDPQLASNLSNPFSGDATPRFNLVESNYSLHSLSYGLQYRY